MTEITKIRPRRTKPQAVKTTPLDQDMLVSILEAALQCAKNAQVKATHRESHLRNCHDALTRAGFYIADELDTID